MPIDPGTAALGAAGIGAGAQALGGIIGSASNKKEGKRAWRRTKKLNQNQIQWRVADAKAAGIHPLAALGMSPIGQSPVNTGSVMGDAIANIGDTVGEGIRGYSQAKANEPVQAQAIRESEARINQSNAAAARDLAEADYTRSQQFWSTMGRIKSPGRPSTNAGPSLAPVGQSGPSQNPAEPPFIPREEIEMFGKIPVGTQGKTWLGTHRASGLYQPASFWEENYGGGVGEVIGFMNFMNEIAGNTLDDNPKIGRVIEHLRRAEDKPFWEFIPELMQLLRE